MVQERLVAIFHFVFALAFAAKIVPQTIWTVHLLFGPSFAVQFNNVSPSSRSELVRRLGFSQKWDCKSIPVEVQA